MFLNVDLLVRDVISAPNVYEPELEVDHLKRSPRPCHRRSALPLTGPLAGVRSEKGHREAGERNANFIFPPSIAHLVVVVEAIQEMAEASMVRAFGAVLGLFALLNEYGGSYTNHSCAKKLLFSLSR